MFITIKSIIINVLAIFLFNVSAEAIPIYSFDFDKTFYSIDVSAKTNIRAGGIAETWLDREFTTTKQKIYKKINWTYNHAAVREQNPQMTINGGLPITNTGKNVAQEYNGTAIANGLAGTANIGIKVSPLVPVGTIVKARMDDDKIEKKHILNRSVKTTMTGKGKLKNTKRARSVDAGGAVKINAKSTFEYSIVNKQPMIKTVSKVKGQILMLASGSTTELTKKEQKGNIKDPFFVEVTDLDSGVSITESIATYDITANNADIIINDASINITIDRFDDNSFASFNFSSELSSWVVNPFSYGVSFDNNGLSLFGSLGALDDWNITMTAEDNMIASYFFEDDFMPFDYMEILPPEEIFTAGYTYEYSQGSTIGASILASVPEPSTLVSLGLGLMGLIVFRRKSVVSRGQTR